MFTKHFEARNMLTTVYVVYMDSRIKTNNKCLAVLISIDMKLYICTFAPSVTPCKQVDKIYLLLISDDRGFVFSVRINIQDACFLSFHVLNELAHHSYIAI